MHSSQLLSFHLWWKYTKGTCSSKSTYSSFLLQEYLGRQKLSKHLRPSDFLNGLGLLILNLLIGYILKVITKHSYSFVIFLKQDIDDVTMLLNCWAYICWAFVVSCYFQYFRCLKGPVLITSVVYRVALITQLVVLIQLNCSFIEQPTRPTLLQITHLVKKSYPCVLFFSFSPHSNKRLHSPSWMATMKSQETEIFLNGNKHSSNSSMPRKLNIRPCSRETVQGQP